MTISLLYSASLLVRCFDIADIYKAGLAKLWSFIHSVWSSAWLLYNKFKLIIVNMTTLLPPPESWPGGHSQG
jgi:hypothetical protein